jgi:uncharacterized membrane protein YphA (DoxX/SURF4 family)
MVPGWLPAHLFFAYFTGAAHIAAAVSIAAGIWDRWAALLLTVMLSCFTLLVNVPLALAAGALSSSAVDLAFALALTGSAAVIAGSSFKQLRPEATQVPATD